MAVDAHHLHPFPSQPVRTSEIIGSTSNQPSFYDMQMGFISPVPGANAACNSLAPVSAAASDSGLTFNDVVAAAAASRKRPCPISFLGDDVSSLLQRQSLDFDRVILQHAETVRAGLAERRRMFARQVVAAVEEDVSKRIKAKEEEIARVGKLNWALEERIKSLYAENQIWRNLAQSNEATANVLRTNLEQVLAAQVMVNEAPATADDAESCCCGDNAEDEEDIGLGREWRRGCWSCREREPSVLLLPCRHLCLCMTCGPTVDACPICNCIKNGIVHVNMS
ncbi:probable BOI-related E3 ubiquitin-protein ligase 3 [Musa acuminata AAA Group]|uniref:(wild Malaysian banana) hypothetical protein n=1 Tax=Musa acuminata subsp. malaccensis TaxID=214687 RepID=A0A804I306_MUSAM|nr:PREDICTED: probable BOI-related E3 ubiquitin-protein ligase 3 [Musa acuminata subsp. malaccensis]CAG1862099.1 unnamed protein product [Musa acuminata subsp. malaccensis]